MNRWKLWTRTIPMVLLAVGIAGVAYGQEAAAVVVEEVSGVSPAMFTVNNLWVMLAGCLVFIMHLGFATVESGLTQSKNTINILFKNTLIPCIGLLTYAICGFALMYPGEFNGWLGWAGFGITKPLNDMTLMGPAYADGGYTWYTDFFFQAMFAATAATIVSGAVAEPYDRPTPCAAQ